MPRAIWTGAISFGLVNVPVRMYSAIEQHDLEFDLIHETDGGPIGYQKYCKLEDKPVANDEIVKGFEYEKGEYVYLSDEDFDAAESEGYKTIDIRDFVPYEEIDPIYFEKTYYLGPQEGSERVYALLLRAMDNAGLAAIAKYNMRERQHLGCLRTRQGVITLEKMYFADEIRPVDEIVPGDVKVDERELEMAEQLIDRFAGRFQPEKYEDTYRDALCDIITAKRKGREVHAAPARAPEEATDIMAALRASLEAARTRKRRAGDRRAGRDGGRNGRVNGDRDLADLSKEELLERAREADVRGRSQMSKDELVQALERVA
jgi:DNA end-binding protein Ku